MHKLQNKTNWKILSIVGLIGLIVMMIQTLGFPLTSTRGSLFPWKEHIVLFLYFTFMSNVMGTVCGFLSGFFNIDLNSKHLQRFKVMAITNLVITMIVYWAMLFPHSYAKQNAFELVTNVLVHFVTPLVIVYAFMMEANSYKTYVSITVKSSLVNIAFPITWSIMALIFYFADGAYHTSAIYSFLDLTHNPWYMSVGVIIGIMGAYLTFTSLFAWLYIRK